MLTTFRHSAVVSGLVLLALALAGGGCRCYYGQAIRGQWELLTAPQPIHDWLARTNTPPALRGKLQLVQQVRVFAERQLQLKANGHYQNYADLGRRFVVWNLYAAPEFSLEDKTWWYPVVGSVSYRGYFREDLARSYGERLARAGWDVHVGGVEAFSTLGWFHDPVLNTFIHREDAELAELLFHELAHQRLFISGDTEFNEAFATAVAQEGARRWLRQRGDPAAAAAYEASARREREFVALLQTTRSELETLYAQTNFLKVAELRTRKAAAFASLRHRYAELKERWGGVRDYDGWFARPLNNALLNTVDTYHHLVPGFAALLARSGGDFEKFYRETRRLGHLRKEERHRALRDLAAGVPAAP